MFDGKPWQLRKTDPDDQPPEHYAATPWAVIHPRPEWGVPRPISRFFSFEEALAFLLRQPEYRRKTSARKEHAHA